MRHAPCYSVTDVVMGRIMRDSESNDESNQIVLAEILKKVRRIQVRASRLVTGAFLGEYQSVFKGRGMEFEEVREYQPGDDFRFIDWNVTARTGRPYMKKFVEERELNVIFMIDVSPSSNFGTVHQIKSELAIEICSLLALSAVKNNDRVGLICFSDRIESFVIPRKGIRHVLRIIRDALNLKPAGKKTDIPLALEFLTKVFKRRTVIFLLSDFHFPNIGMSLSIAAKKHDIVAITLTDPAELSLPAIGIVGLDDPETGEEFLIDTSSREVRDQYEQRGRKRIEGRNRFLDSIPVDHVDIRTDLPYLSSLVRFFRMRKARYSR